MTGRSSPKPDGSDAGRKDDDGAGERDEFCRRFRAETGGSSRREDAAVSDELFFLRTLWTVGPREAR